MTEQPTSSTNEDCVYVLIGFRQELIDAEFTRFQLDKQYTVAAQAKDEKTMKKLKRKRAKIRKGQGFAYLMMGPSNCGIFKTKDAAIEAINIFGDTNYGCYPYYLIERHFFGYDCCDFSREAETWFKRKKNKEDNDIVYTYHPTDKPECYVRTAVFM